MTEKKHYTFSELGSEARADFLAELEKVLFECDILDLEEGGDATFTGFVELQVEDGLVEFLAKLKVQVVGDDLNISVDYDKDDIMDNLSEEYYYYTRENATPEYSGEQCFLNDRGMKVFENADKVCSSKEDEIQRNILNFLKNNVFCVAKEQLAS